MQEKCNTIIDKVHSEFYTGIKLNNVICKHKPSEGIIHRT